MKLCYPVATPDTADTNMMALRGAPERCFELLARHGYDAAELMLRDPALLSAGQLARMANDAGLALPAVSTGQLRKEDGLSLSNLDNESRKRAITQTCRTIDFAGELGAVVNIGTLRGNVGTPETRAVAVRSFTEIASYAADHKVQVLIEPQCRWVVNWLNRIDETLAFIREIGDDSFGILFDFYHSSVEEPSLYAALITAWPHVGWIQISDSNRLAPGKGHADWSEWLPTLKALGHHGYLSVECLQIPDSEAALIQGARHLNYVCG